MLELGGNAATIVCEDADVAAAARICARTGYSNSGQSCISVQRVYVHRDRFDEFVDAFTEEVAKLSVGDPLDPATDVGSMVDERGRRAGGPLGGRGGRGRRRGRCSAAPATARPCARPWSPIRPPTRVGGHPRGVRRAGGRPAVRRLRRGARACNASRFGLQAGLFTRDIGRIITAWRELEVGGLVVNGSSNFRLDHVPFGGVKDSGFGRESPRWMIEDYTVVKTLMLRGVSICGEDGRVTITAADALVAQLESYGVEYVFGTCGHTNIALLDALGRSPIEFVIARHEQAAAHAADGYARATGKPGVLLMHVGPGHDERGHRRGHRRPGLGAAGRDHR